jgi:hypothetical protein
MANPIAMRSSNPALSTDTFGGTRAAVGQDAMTIQGTVNKTALALLILVATASYTWNLGVADPRIPAFTMVGVIGGLIAAMVTIFKKEWAATTTPIYAGLAGLALGGISAVFEARFPGLVSQAVFLTFERSARSSSRTARDSSGRPRTSSSASCRDRRHRGHLPDQFRDELLRLQHPDDPFERHVRDRLQRDRGRRRGPEPRPRLRLHRAGAERGAPKYMEWYGAFGLLVTLVWLYLEILRLLAKLQERR